MRLEGFGLSIPRVFRVRFTQKHSSTPKFNLNQPMVGWKTQKINLPLICFAEITSKDITQSRRLQTHVMSRESDCVHVFRISSGCHIQKWATMTRLNYDSWLCWLHNITHYWLLGLFNQQFWVQSVRLRTCFVIEDLFLNLQTQLRYTLKLTDSPTENKMESQTTGHWIC